MQKVTPHWGWFLLAPAVLVLGGIASFVVMFGGMMSAAEGMERVSVPGESTIHVDEAGQQPVFYETTGYGPATVPEGLSVEITPLSGGGPLKITPSSSGQTTTYNYNGVNGRNYGTVNFPSAGEYKVSATLPLGATGGKIAFPGKAGAKVVGSILGFLGVGAASFILCIIIVVVVAVKRSGSRKRMLQQQYNQLPQGGMPPAPPPGATNQ